MRARIATPCRATPSARNTNSSKAHPQQARHHATLLRHSSSRLRASRRKTPKASRSVRWTRVTGTQCREVLVSCGALHRRYADLVVLHIDARTDTFPSDGGVRQRYSLPDAYTHGRRLGYRVIADDECRPRGMANVMREIREALAGRPVYLCFDMDYFDPSCAPGVCTPAWGGATAYEGLMLLRVLSGLRFVAFDVNTVSPPHDVAGMTAFLAAACVREFLFLAVSALGRNTRQVEGRP
jgi:arginase family enzyme